jgi:phospholipid/cholesterol/gamma-HCH transport system ATP-binding protein
MRTDERATPLALSVRGLTGPAGDHIIFDVDLDLPVGATQLVLGPIHSGKSMLMRHLVGLERAAHGTIVLTGQTYDAATLDEAAFRKIRPRIGTIFEGSALISRIGIVDNVELPLLEHTELEAGDAREAARELLDIVGIDSHDDVTPAQLGRAERRLVALARAIALRPSVLLLDEPTVGLDSHSAAQFDETLARLQADRGFGILMFSHEVRHAFGRTEHIYVMAHGRIVEHADRDTLRASSNSVVRRLLDRRGRE